jgi:hypothetical protein
MPRITPLNARASLSGLAGGLMTLGVLRHALMMYNRSEGCEISGKGKGKGRYAPGSLRVVASTIHAPRPANSGRIHSWRFVRSPFAIDPMKRVGGGPACSGRLCILNS